MSFKHTCKDCGVVKDSTQFYKCKAMSLGISNSCIECYKKKVTKNRIKNISYYRAQDRKRGYHGDGKNSNRVKYPKQYKATNAVNNALRDGRLVRKVCEVCGDPKSHAHHDDYDFPLVVRWLCPLHHKEWHIVNGEAKNRV